MRVFTDLYTDFLHLRNSPANHTNGTVTPSQTSHVYHLRPYFTPPRKPYKHRRHTVTNLFITQIRPSEKYTVNLHHLFPLLAKIFVRNLSKITPFYTDFLHLRNSPRKPYKRHRHTVTNPLYTPYLLPYFIPIYIYIYIIFNKRIIKVYI